MPNLKIADTLATDDGRKPDVVYRRRPDRIAEHRADAPHYLFTSENNILLRLTVLTPEIVRVSYAAGGAFRHEFSYAIDPGAVSEWGAEAVGAGLKEGEDHFELRTSALQCRVTKEGMRVHFYDLQGQPLCRDDEGFYQRDTLKRGVTEVRVTKESPQEEQFYGLGDKPIAQEMRGRRLENWNTDSFAYERGSDPIYRSIPFYMGLREGRGYGIFFDNSYRTRFDFDSRGGGTCSFWANGGEMHYYFIAGPKLEEVAARYALLTGTPEQPPLWALGYHQCRWSYFPEERVREIADTFREKEIPCDAIYLDIDYMERYKVFTWDTEIFPDPGKMIADLAGQGFRTVVMIDPGILAEEGYHVYDQARDNGYLCTRPDGEPMIGPVWPPRCVWPDYTDPKVREWWGDLYREFMSELKIAGIWNDMNEPAMFEVDSFTFPEDIRHDYDGHPASHKKAHNIYGMQMARASYHGIKKHNPEERPFLLTRASFSGGQRYAALWTGDNIATWDHLRLASEQCIRLSISGFSFCGTDIGGFAEDPSPELFARWIQLGIFHPLFRTHSMGYNEDGAAAVEDDKLAQVEAQNVLHQEPWVFGDTVTAINREMIGLRYRLLDYLYSAFRRYSTEGRPILKPLRFWDQEDEAADGRDEFLFGDKLLVSPVLEKGKTTQKAYLPNGTWYHYWDDKPLEGGSEHTVKAPLSRIPFFVRAGTVLPLREPMQYTDQKVPDTRELVVYWGGEPEESFLYEDAEQGYGYRDGQYRETRYRFEPGSGDLSLRAIREGSFDPPHREVEVTFVGLPFEPAGYRADGEEGAPEKIKRNGRDAYRTVLQPGWSELQLSS